MKRSLPPSSGVMNPYPFESLNHFTIPVAIEKHLPCQLTNGQGRRCAQPNSLWIDFKIAEIRAAGAPVRRMAYRGRRSDRSVDRLSRRCDDALARSRSCLLLLEFQGATLLHLALSRHLRERGLPLAPHEVLLSFVVACVGPKPASEADSTGLRATGTCIHSARPHRTSEQKLVPQSAPFAFEAPRLLRVGVLRPQAGTLYRTSRRTLHLHRPPPGAPDLARLRWLNSSGFRSRKMRLAARSDAEGGALWGHGARRHSSSAHASKR